MRWVSSLRSPCGRPAAAGRRRGEVLLTGLVVAVVAGLSSGCTAVPDATRDDAGLTHSPTTVIVSGQTVATTATVQPSSVGAGRPDSTVPPVVTYAWLDGRPAGGGGEADSEGVEVPIADGTRWQGDTPGEYALLAPDAGEESATGSDYRWFGADGGMVGCAAGACVGIDAAGYTAVVQRPGAPRAVFSPTGEYVGTFDRAGKVAAEVSVSTDLDTALASTGVDLVALLDRGTGPVPFAGGVTGDPHLITVGRQRATTQLTGEFHARAGDPDRAIQLRLEPMAHRRDVSVVTAVALSAGQRRIEVTAQGRLTVDGAEVAASDRFEQTSIEDGPEIGRWPADEARTVAVAVVWPDGGTLSLSANPALGMTVVAHLPRVAGLGGVFGSGRPAASGDDLRDRQDRAVPAAEAVAAWQIGSRERSLFDERIDPTPGFPEQAATPPAEAMVAAAQACAAADLAEGPDLSACVFDVALTGDEGFAVGHADLVTPASRPTAPPGVAGRWPALVAGLGVVAVELPDDGRIRSELQPGAQAEYRFDVAYPGVVTVQPLVSACGSDEAAIPGAGQAAARLFDGAGRPVTGRLPLCGSGSSTEGLVPGAYKMVVAGTGRRSGGVCRSARQRFVTPTFVTGRLVRVAS